MTGDIHHAVCVTDDPEAVAAFLQLLGLDLLGRAEAAPETTSAVLSWPAGSPGTISTILGRSASGVIELVRLPEQLKGVVQPGTALISFAVDDLEERVAACRERGLDVTDILHGRAGDVDVSLAVVHVGA